MVVSLDFYSKSIFDVVAPNYGSDSLFFNKGLFKGNTLQIYIESLKHNAQGRIALG